MDTLHNLRAPVSRSSSMAGHSLCADVSAPSGNNHQPACAKTQCQYLAAFALASLLSVPVIAEEGKVNSFPIIVNDGTEFEWPRLSPPIIAITSMDQQMLALVDTGTSHHLFDKTHEAKLGPRKAQITANKTGDQVVVNVFRAPTIRVAGLKTHESQYCATIDMDAFRRATGRPIHAFLAARFLQGRTLTFDASRELIQIRDGGIVRETPVNENDVALNVDADFRPFVAGNFAGGVTANLLLDTGLSTSLALEPNVFQSLVAAGEIHHVRTIPIVNASGRASTRTGLLDNFKLGNIHQSGIQVVESPSSRLGIRFLQRFRGTLDISSRVLRLSKIQTHSGPDATDASGIHMLREENRIVIHSVDSNSPAERAGLQHGDVIVQIDGVPVLPDGIYRIRSRLFDDAAPQVHVIVLRKNRTISKTVVLEAYSKWATQGDSEAEGEREQEPK